MRREESYSETCARLARKSAVVERVAARLYGGPDWDQRDHWPPHVLAHWLGRARSALWAVGQVLDEEDREP